MSQGFTKLILGGDVMLGRLVGDVIQVKGHDYPMHKIAQLLQSADATIVNLECAITKSRQLWSGRPKAFYFGAPPIAATILKNCRIKMVSLANNHSLDYDFIGLRDTLHYLQQENILMTGAGENFAAACTPAILALQHITLGMVAFCDHQSDFAATNTQAGIAYLDLNTDEIFSQLQKSLTQMQTQSANWPILSLHWGPNQAIRPTKRFIEIAHTAIDMGYKTIFGHSAHNFLGVEFYRGFPIMYSAGDLVDDYYVDPFYKNDHQLLFELQIKNDRVTELLLHPIFIEHCQVQPANAEQFDWIAKKAAEMCQELGTSVQQVNGTTLKCLHAN